MSKVIYIALEDLPQRYTQMMNRSIIDNLNKEDIVVYPNIAIDDKIHRGQFLDIVNTSRFKAAQLQEIAKLFDAGMISDGDAFLIGDIFFPGIESIKYMSELLGIDVKVYGINYAGRADSTDFVQKLSSWADYSETGYHMICDGIFVGSDDHRNHVIEYFGLNPATVHVTGLIWDLNYMEEFKASIGTVAKEDFIIWPHRWAKEKGVDDLIEFANRTDKKIIVTSSGPEKPVTAFGALPENIEFRFNLTKLEYFTLMAKAKWYLSTAYQETFGYTVQEAIYFGCNILVPNRACNPEMVPLRNVYHHVSHIDHDFDSKDLTVPYIWTSRWNNNARLMLSLVKEEIDAVPANYFNVRYL